MQSIQDPHTKQDFQIQKREFHLRKGDEQEALLHHSPRCPLHPLPTQARSR